MLFFFQNKTCSCSGAAVVRVLSLSEADGEQFSSTQTAVDLRLVALAVM